jgi:hypothetical protein
LLLFALLVYGVCGKRSILFDLTEEFKPIKANTKPTSTNAAWLVGLKFNPTNQRLYHMLEKG